jgi:hypothetical protein
MPIFFPPEADMDDGEAFPFEFPSQEVTDAVTRGLTLLVQYRRGQTVLWAAIEAEAGFDRDHPHWSAFWHRLKRDFRETTGIVLWVVDPGVGPRLLTVDETLGFRSRARHLRARRQMHRDLVELAALPDADLTERQREEKAVRVGVAKLRLRDVDASARRAAMLGRPSDSGVPNVRVNPYSPGR